MKKSIKIVSILMMAIMMIMVSTPVFAKTVGGVTIDTSKDIDTSTKNSVSQLAGTILNAAQFIAIIASVIIVAILGIKYMMGSLEEKAEYKKSFIPLIVGVIVVFGAITIANLLINTFSVL